MKSRTAQLITGLVAVAIAATTASLLTGPAPAGPPAPRPSEGRQRPAEVAFTPYVDASHSTAYDMAGTARGTGADGFTLGFVTARGSCAPTWDGRDGIAHQDLTARITALRATGRDVRISFGGADGTELAGACDDVGELTSAYADVIDRYRLTRVDFDVEGDDLTDVDANTRRARAVAGLQREARREGRTLSVSFTLPVMPSGLTAEASALLADARRQGVRVDAVNIMAMDYGEAYTGGMGGYAIQAATAAHGQLKELLGLSGTAAWRSLVVTPMIGVNDIEGEVFTVRDATVLAAFARDKGLGGLSMWSVNRDHPCEDGTKGAVLTLCSGVDQTSLAFARALARA
ncbi:chitinase [Streptomyces sp. NPDC026673]|uniref:chitinase n=1 Tax=Streptomyces sp. NPDC026673 TaxID=3155724 RepID=UPI003405EDF1